MRRLVIIFGSVGVAVIAAVLLLPWWLGGILPLVGPPFGLKFNGYARDGYSRFRLRALEIQRATVTVHVQAIEADTPLLWCWHRLRRNGRAVAAGTWRVEVQSPAPGANPASGARGWIPLKNRLGVIADRMDFWLPRAHVGAGVVRWPGHEITFGPATWENRTLSVTEVGYLWMHGTPTLQLSTDHEMRLTLTLARDAASAVVSTTGATVTGTVNGWGQPAELVAHFAEQNWTPLDAALRANHWAIPAERLKRLGSYASVQGAGVIEWREQRLTADLSIEGVALDTAAAPSLSAKIHAHADAGAFVADALSVELPGVSARLSEPLAIDAQGRVRANGARFTFEADLAKLPWFGLEGAVRGEAKVGPGVDRAVSVDFSLDGEKVQAAGIEASRVALAGKLAWPRLEGARGQVEFADGHALTVSGNVDFLARTVTAAGARGSIGRSSVAYWLPANMTFDSLEFAVDGAGPWREIEHAGKVSVKKIALAGMKSFDAELDWRAQGEAVEAFGLRAIANKTSLRAEGTAKRGQVTVATLTLEREDGAQLKLRRPATVDWGNGVAIDALSVAGGDTALDATLRWAANGQIELTAQRIASTWLDDIFELPKTRWTAEALTLKAQWSNGPAAFTLEGRVAVDASNGRAAQVSVQSTGDAAGIEIGGLQVGEGDEVIVKASGHLPIVLLPGRKPWFEVASNSPFVLDATTSPNPKFWQTVADLTGFEVLAPELTAHVQGTLADPQGEVHLRAERIALVPGRLDWRWPKIETLDAELTGDASGVTLKRFSVVVAGQSVRAEGRLPVATDHWGELLADPAGFARRGDLHVEIPDADLAAVAPYFPAYLAPKGRLQVDLRFNAAEAINGFVRVKDATSRPLGPLGVLQEINADVRFDGRAVNVSAVTAKMGGQRVTLQGSAELPAKGRPIYDLTLVGSNLPFVRQTGLLLRGDLDLKLTSAANGRAAITGAVRLRDSLFLSDIRALIPSGRKGSAARPPYFSIEAEPLNRWRLDVAVEGKKFLRLRTPVFNGLASARFQLSGTLGAPLAVGEATVEEGTIRLPFANFRVQQGQVRLAPDQPEPQIYLTSSTRRYGYDVRMELSGPAMAPIITFSSSPPLESEQVLLMVMAGQAPRDEIASTGRQRAARFGAFFGQSLLGAMGGDGEGADRLTISSGENVSAQGRETYSIEYRLNDDWAVTGEYDEFDEYYGGVKWRFYQKGGTRADDKK